MPPIRRRLRAAAFSLSALAAAGAPALAQNESSNSIGPPQLKDFSLPGQRTTPPATPAPAVPTPRPPAAEPETPPAADPSTRRPPVAAPRTAPAPRAAGTAPAPAQPAPATPGPTLPQAEPPAPAQKLPPPSSEPAVAPAPAPDPAPATAGPKGAFPFWPAAGGALLLLGFAAFLLLRRRRIAAERESERDSARGELGAVLAAGPLPEPDPAPEPAARPGAPPAPEVPAAPRPWIELDIVPERAAATGDGVYVRYALTLTNAGQAGARNIRIDPRLFNAGAEAEMMAFFQGPIHELSGSPHVVLPPGGSIKLNGEVAMPNAELREIELGGRRIFVPMVAINVAYDWAEGGAGRTSRSWLVGREAEVPTEKMGPFRLDLGPRIYRSVGRREARLVMV